MTSRYQALLFVTTVMLVDMGHSQDDAWRFTGPNVALGKSTSQGPITHSGMGSERAVDNNTNPETNAGSCAHTDGPNTGKATWAVNLGREYVIKGIRIYNRNILQSRLQNFQIYGSYPQILLYDDQAAAVPLYSQNVLDVAITAEVPVSTITIELPPRGGEGAILTLCEVQIFVYADCSPPPDITNGVYFGKLKIYYVVGESVVWTCEPGYAPRTNFSRTCKIQTSSWSNQGTNCKKYCSLKSNLENGELNLVKGDNLTLAGDTEQAYSRNTVLEVVCNIGFKTKFTNITCGSRGDWDNVALCDPVTNICEKLVYLENGTYMYSLDGVVLGDKQWYPLNTIAVAKCNELFELSGNAESRVCTLNGSWTGRTPTCASGIDTTVTGIQTKTVTGPLSASVTVPQSEPVTIPQSGTTDPPVQTAIVGGALGGVILILLVAIIVVMIVRKRRRDPHDMSEPIASKDQYIGDSNANISEVGVYSEIRELDMIDNVGSTAATATESATYYSFTTPVKKPERGIKLEELSDFVLSADFFHKKYTKEFKSFPDGLTKAHKAGARNKSRNKYRNVVPYDDTRVILEIWNSKRETDYLNASYIHGFTRQRAYIASQGVIKDNMNDFWRMIWQNNVGKIVMLTGVKEGEKIKCEQYWPSNGPTSYGSIQVSIKITETFSNFVIRHLSVRRKNEASRRVLHFHFTAWPDKDVPLYCTALVHFRAKVRESVSNCEGPLVVHCSAGIGRTGTYIALDYLTDQGRALGVVDVPGCVETLRRQRVNMVQTKEQYIFVHQALVETLMLSTSALPTAQFHDTYKELQNIDPIKQKSKIDVEYEILGTMPAIFEENQYAIVKKGQSRDKNRYLDISPVMEYMPSLCGPGIGGTKDGYINAVFMQSYKNHQALIITQTPLESTRHDFWRMVYHQDVNTIVMMNHKAEMTDTDVYWPEAEQEIEFDDMKIINSSREKEIDNHVVLSLSLETKTDRRVVKLIQFGEWKLDSSIPSDPEHILTALKLVQDWQRHTGNNPIIVHCMNGAEKSGLFCMLYALLERTMIEHDVAIPQVIQEMRHRRKLIIPNVDQFVFSYEVVLMFLNEFETYANFAI